MLSWRKFRGNIMNLYQHPLGAANLGKLDDLNDDAALEGIAKRYAAYKVAKPLSYATVEDFCDGVDNLQALAVINQDLKDAQRPWVLKAILGTIPPGGKLLEIGAGDPWVADLLSRLGYQVTVIDPYDGRDRGPDQFDSFKNQFPKITFLRGLFPEGLHGEVDSKFDCIYSISVLEHLPHDAISSVMTGIALHSRGPEALTIHAIDHVHLGNGAEHHLANLGLMAKCFGFRERELPELLKNMDADPETYFLAAEAHNRWRGKTLYRDFPMRRCVSIQVCSVVGQMQEPASQ
jgi:hypothetical protein